MLALMIGLTIQEQQLGAINAKMEDRATVKHKFTQEQYDAAVERVLADERATVANIRAAPKQKKATSQLSLLQRLSAMR